MTESSPQYFILLLVIGLMFLGVRFLFSDNDKKTKYRNDKRQHYKKQVSHISAIYNFKHFFVNGDMRADDPKYFLYLVTHPDGREEFTDNPRAYPTIAGYGAKRLQVYTPDSIAMMEKIGYDNLFAHKETTMQTLKDDYNDNFKHAKPFEHQMYYSEDD